MSSWPAGARLARHGAPKWSPHQGRVAFARGPRRAPSTQPCCSWDEAQKLPGTEPMTPWGALPLHGASPNWAPPEVRLGHLLWQLRLWSPPWRTLVAQPVCWEGGGRDSGRERSRESLGQGPAAEKLPEMPPQAVSFSDPPTSSSPRGPPCSSSLRWQQGWAGGLSGLHPEKPESFFKTAWRRGSEGNSSHGQAIQSWRRWPRPQKISSRSKKLLMGLNLAVQR